MALAFIRYKIVPQGSFSVLKLAKVAPPITEYTEMTLVKQMPSLWQGVCQARTEFTTTD